MIQVVAPPWAEMKDFSSLRSLVNHTWLTHCILLPTQSDIEARGLPIWRNERARWVAFQAQSVQLQERLASVTLSRWAAQTPWLAGLPQHVRDSLFGMIEAQSDVAYSVEKIGSEYSVRLANLWAAATVFFGTLELSPAFDVWQGWQQVLTTALRLKAMFSRPVSGEVDDGMFIVDGIVWPFSYGVQSR